LPRGHGPLERQLRQPPQASGHLWGRPNNDKKAKKLIFRLKN
jgi:hypothetical protein